MAYVIQAHDKYGDLSLILQKNLADSSIGSIKFWVLFLTAVLKIGNIVLKEVGKNYRMFISFNLTYTITIGVKVI